MTAADSHGAEHSHDAEQEAGADAAGTVEIVFLDAADVPVRHKSADRMIMMRDPNGPNGTALYFTESEWEAFIAGVKDGEFDELL